MLNTNKSQHNWAKASRWTSCGFALLLILTMASCSETVITERALKRFYPDLKKINWVEKLDEDAVYDYKFSIEEYCSGGVIATQEGFIRLYDDGTISDVMNYGTPTFKDSKGNPIDPLK